MYNGHFLRLAFCFVGLFLFSGQVSGREDTLVKSKEYSNAIIFSGTDYYWRGQFRRVGVLLFWKDNQIGVYYQRKLYKNLHLTVGYNQFNSLSPWRKQELWIGPSNDSFQPGAVVGSGKFKMVDLSAVYIYNGFKKHKISIGVGVSYTSGFSEIIDSVTVFPGYYDALVHSHSEKVFYYGFVPSASYDYLFFKNRIRLGVDMRYRKYRGYYFSRMEYGVHLGFNF